MRTKKKLLAIVLTLAMALSLLPVTALADGEVVNTVAVTASIAKKTGQDDNTKVTVSGEITVTISDDDKTAGASPSDVTDLISKISIQLKKDGADSGSAVELSSVSANFSQDFDLTAEAYGTYTAVVTLTPADTLPTGVTIAPASITGTTAAGYKYEDTTQPPSSDTKLASVTGIAWSSTEGLSFNALSDQTDVENYSVAFTYTAATTPAPDEGAARASTLTSPIIVEKPTTDGAKVVVDGTTEDELAENGNGTYAFSITAVATEASSKEDSNAATKSVTIPSTGDGDDDTDTPVTNPGDVSGAITGDNAITTNSSSTAESVSSDLAAALGVTADNLNNSGGVLVQAMAQDTSVVSTLSTMETGMTGSDATASTNASSLGLSTVSAVGLKLNRATATTNVTLTVDTTSSTYSAPANTRSDTMFAFKMTLTGTSSTTAPVIPIAVTLPIPTTFRNAANVKVYHVTNGTVDTTPLPSRTSGNTITVICTAFSDFVMAETGSAITVIPGGSTSGGTTSGGTTSGGSSSGGGGGGSSSSSSKTPVAKYPGAPENTVNNLDDPNAGTSTPTSTGTFSDVPSTFWAAEQIKWASDNGIMNGTGGGNFSPNGLVTRQALWMVLARIAKANPANMSAAKDWAVENGISDGSSAGNSMSRQQLVTMLYRFAQAQGLTVEGAADLSTYPDNAALASYAQEAMAWAVQNGIVTGTSDGRLNPEGTASRAQFAVILYRFADLTNAI